MLSAKIGIFGEFTSNNQGDRLIGQGMECLFSEQGYTITLLPLGKISEQQNNSPNEKTVNLFRRCHRNFFQAYKTYRHAIELILFMRNKKRQQQDLLKTLSNIDYVVIGGGQLLGDNSLRMILKIDLLIDEAEKRGQQIALFAVGIDNPGTLISRFFLKRIFKRLQPDHIYVRDKTSRAVYMKLRKKKSDNAQLIPDAAFYAYETCSFAKTDDVIIGLAPQSYRTLSNKIKRKHLYNNQWWCEVAKELHLQGARPVFFSSGVQSDHDRAEDICNSLKQEGLDIRLLERPVTTEQLREQLVSMSSILAQRLHISIAYYALGGIPASLGWHSKVEDFYLFMGLGERFFGEKAEETERVVQLLCKEAAGSSEQTAELQRNLRSAAEKLTESFSRSVMG